MKVQDDHEEEYFTEDMASADWFWAGVAVGVVISTGITFIAFYFAGLV